MQTQRKFPRVKVNRPTHVSGEAADEFFLEGRCCDIGGGGFSFLLNHPFAVGSWLTIEIDLGSERLNARGVVVGCQAEGGEPGLWRISTRLEELPEEDRRRLDSALLAV